MKLHAKKETVRKYYKYKSPAVGYRQLTYLENTTTQYIDTNVKMGTNIKFEVHFNPKIVDSAYRSLLACRISSNSQAISQAFTSSGTYIGFGDNSEPTTLNPSCKPVVNDWNIFIQDKTQVSINNNIQTYKAGYTTNFTVLGNLYLFARNNINSSSVTTSISNYSESKIRLVKIWNNNILVRDFVPCERLSDNAIGMYDKVNNIFYLNNGTGSFIGGDYIKEETTPDDYDFYEDVEMWKTPLITTRKYYKYSYQPFTQPVLTSNGTIGGNIFAVTSTVGTEQEGTTNVAEAYKVFDGDTSSIFTMRYNSSTDTQTLKFYNPNGINFENLSVTFLGNAYAIWCWRSGTLKGSNDGTNWTEISTFTNTSTSLTIMGTENYYKYYAIDTKGTNYSNVYHQASIYEIVINNGNERIQQEANPDDYDFYEDITKYCASKQGV